jgi:hypothetical protein
MGWHKGVAFQGQAFPAAVHQGVKIGKRRAITLHRFPKGGPVRPCLSGRRTGGGKIRLVPAEPVKGRDIGHNDIQGRVTGVTIKMTQGLNDTGLGIQNAMMA